MEKYPELRYEIHIERKPRGNWRPRARIKFLKTENPLGILRNIRAMLYYERSCEGCTNEPHIVMKSSLPFWKTPHRNGGETPAGCCYRSGYSNIIFIKIDIENNTEIAFYLDWRTGVKPDYSDYAEILKNFCDAIVAEYVRRCEEALESGESDEIIITPESVIEKPDEARNEKKVSRKIKIA